MKQDKHCKIDKGIKRIEIKNFKFLFCIYSIIIFTFSYIFLSIYMYNFVPIPNPFSGKLEKKFLVSDIKDNLIQLNLQNDVLTSNGEDPQIHINLNENINKSYIVMNVTNLKEDGIVTDSVESKVYFAKNEGFTESKCKNFKLKNGINVVRINTDEGFDSLRLDFGSFPNISYEVKEIKVSNTFPMYLPLLIKVFILYSVFMFLFIINRYENIKIKNYINKIDKVFCEMFKPFKIFYCEFRKFVVDNRNIIIIVGVIAFACFGLLMTYHTVYIDEEAAMMTNNGFINWISQGRFGNYLIDKFLLVNHKFTPFIGDFFASVLLTISALIMCFNISSISKRVKLNKIAIVVFSAIYMSMPFTVGGYMVVGSYNVEMGIALCCVSIAAYISLVYKTPEKLDYIWAIILLAFAFSTYQAHIAFFVTIVAIYSFIYVLHNIENDNFKKILYIVGSNAVICMSAAVLYYIGDKICTHYIVKSSNYLQDNFIGWGKGNSVVSVLSTVFKNIYNIYYGSDTMLYGGIIINVSVAIFILFIVYKATTIKKNRVLFLFLSISIFVSPFIVIIAIGSPIMAGRTLLGLSLFIASIWYILIEFSSELKFYKTLIVLMASILVILQVQYLNKFFYADYNRYNMDVNLTNLMMNDIRVVNDNKLKMPVVFIGTYNYPNNGVMLNYDLLLNYELAGSYYSVDGGSNTRIIHFIQTLGYPVIMPTVAQINDSKRYISDMENWPSKKSIKVVNDYVIVKLS